MIYDSLFDDYRDEVIGRKTIFLTATDEQGDTKGQTDAPISDYTEQPSK